jgi:hypothetical protein
MSPPAPGGETRRHPRYPVGLRLRLHAPAGEVEARTRTISREGLDVRLPDAPGLGERRDFTLDLPDGSELQGEMECRSRGPEGLCGFVLHLDTGTHAHWDAFMDQEESTGSLWRLVGRYATARGDERETVRGVLERGRLGPLFRRVPWLSKAAPDEAEGVLRFHMTGENGEAYRICFERHAWTPADACDLVETHAGFADLARSAVLRVLDKSVVLRLAPDLPAQQVRICQLKRGGFGYVQGGEGMPTGLVSLAVGELMLIEVDGERVFPEFSDDELERIACDTFRADLSGPVFKAPGIADADTVIRDRAEASEGVAAVVGAVEAAEVVQTRAYGERRIQLFPEVWVRVQDADGHEVMGPTMQDGDRPLALALVGHGSPRVVRLEDAKRVVLMSRGAG